MTDKQLKNKEARLQKKIDGLKGQIKALREESRLQLKTIRKLEKLIETDPDTPDSPFSIDSWQKKYDLSANDCIFVSEYLVNGLNATQAYRKAHPNCAYGTASVQGPKILGKPGVQAAIKAHVESIVEDSRDVLRDQILAVLKVRAFYDLTPYIHRDGRLKVASLQQIPKELRVAIDGIERRNPVTGVTTIKLANRMEALKELVKYIQLYVTDTVPLELKMTEETANNLQAVLRGSNDS